MAPTNDQDLIILSDESVGSMIDAGPIVDKNEGLNNNLGLDLISFDETNLMQNSSVSSMSNTGLNLDQINLEKPLESNKQLNSDLISFDETNLSFNNDKSIETPKNENLGLNELLSDISSPIFSQEKQELSSIDNTSENNLNTNLFGEINFDSNDNQNIKLEESNANIITVTDDLEDIVTSPQGIKPITIESIPNPQTTINQFISNENEVEEDMNTILSYTISKLKVRQDDIKSKKSQKISQIDELEDKIKKLKEQVLELKHGVTSFEQENEKIELNISSLEEMKLSNKKEVKNSRLIREHNTKKVIQLV